MTLTQYLTLFTTTTWINQLVKQPNKQPNKQRTYNLHVGLLANLLSTCIVHQSINISMKQPINLTTRVQDKIPLDKIPRTKAPRTKTPIFGRTKSPPDINPPEKKCYKSLSVN